MKKIDIAKSKHIKLMPYGYPGSGKTHLCGTFALDDRTAPVLHIDCGGNPETLGKFEQIGDVLRLERIAELNAVHDFFVKGQPTNHVLVSQFGVTPGYKTLILDGISDLQRYSFVSVMGEENQQIADVPRKPEFGDWRAVLGQMTKISKKLFDLSMHVVVTAWEKADTDQDTGITRFRPLLVGQSIDTVPGYALAVGRMINPSRADGKVAQLLKDNASAKSIIIFVPTKNYDAKDQHGFGVPALLDPSASKLLDLIGG